MCSLILVLGACSSGSSRPNATTGSTAPPTLTDGDVLARVSFQPGDLKPGYRAQLYQQGDVVAGQVTLDLCGAGFASEQRRVARHQVGVVDAHQRDQNVSVEAVLYDSTTAAQQAMHELRKAQAECPSGYVSGDVAGEPPLRYRFAPAPDATWVNVSGVDRFVVASTVNDQQGHNEQDLDVYQQRGRLLVGLYTSDPDATTPVLAMSTAAYTHVLALRMNALSATAVG